MSAPRCGAPAPGGRRTCELEAGHSMERTPGQPYGHGYRGDDGRMVRWSITPEQVSAGNTKSPDTSPRLGQRGQIYVSLSAGQRYAEGRGQQIEEARRELTELLIDARHQSEGPPAKYRIHAWPDGAPEYLVRAEGNTLAQAVHKAVSALNWGVGKADKKERLGAGEWRWTWSGHVLRVHEVRPSGGSGTSVARADRVSRKIELSLPDDVHAVLDELAPRYGSRSAVVTAWARAAKLQTK